MIVAVPRGCAVLERGAVSHAKARKAGAVNGRGEHHFVHLPRVAARLCDRFLAVEPIQGRNREVAQQLVSTVSHGRGWTSARAPAGSSSRSMG